MYKFIALDLDGTLLNDKKEISKQDNDTIKKICNNNIGLILVSGRHYNEIVSYYNFFGLQNRDNYIIACDGQYIYSCNGELLKKNELLMNDVLDKYISENEIKNCLIVTSDKGDIYYTSDFLQFFKYLLKRKKVRLSLKKIHNIEKIIISESCKKPGIYYNMKLGISETVFNNSRIEIKNEKVGKWQALCQLMEITNSNSDEIIYCGDDWNDLECFKNFSNKIIMKNSSDGLKQFGGFFTKSNNEDGVSIGLKHYIND